MLLGGTRFNALIVLSVFTFSALLVLRRLNYLTNTGGGEYQHADWLINYSDGLIRRGVSGEIFLRLADALSASPLVLVSAVQGSLTLLLIVGLFAKAYQVGMSDRVTILLLSPALVLFWVNDIGGAFRKELLGLSAFLPILWAAPEKGRAVVVWTTLALFGVAVFFHEANVFLAPALVLALYYRLGPSGIALPASVVGGSAVSATVFALVFLHVPDTTAMCQRLVDAGLSRDQLCGGILRWMDDSFSNNLEKVDEIIDGGGGVPPVVFVVIGLLLLPGALIGLELIKPLRERMIFAASVAFPFCLYFVATDWSRWLSMQVFAMTFLLLILTEQRSANGPALPRLAFVAVIAASLLVGIASIIPLPVVGFVPNLLSSVLNFVI